MNARSRNLLILIASLLVAGTGLAVVAFGNLGANLVYYWSPGEMLAQGPKAYHATIRLGGVIEPGSIQWDTSHTKLTFRVADSKEPGAPEVTVASDQIPPPMFREGIGAVVEGTYDGSKVFTAQRVMVKHSNEYRPPKDGAKHDWKDSLEDGAKQAKNP